MTEIFAFEPPILKKKFFLVWDQNIKVSMERFFFFFFFFFGGGDTMRNRTHSFRKAFLSSDRRLLYKNTHWKKWNNLSCCRLTRYNQWILTFCQQHWVYAGRKDREKREIKVEIRIWLFIGIGNQPQSIIINNIMISALSLKVGAL